MNGFLITANVITFLAFVVHTFVGDKEIKILEPNNDNAPDFVKREKWTMARCGWHWISFDLLTASMGLFLINFTEVLLFEVQLLQLMSLYFLGYGFVWLFTIIISKSFPKSYLKLGQWLLLWLISGFIYLGI